MKEKKRKKKKNRKRERIHMLLKTRKQGRGPSIDADVYILGKSEIRK